MSEVAEKATSMAEETEEHAEHDKKKQLSFDIDWGGLKEQVVGLLATAVKLVCLVFALILVMHIVLYIAGANTHNGIVQMINQWAANLQIGFKNMFGGDKNLKVLLNNGVAAIFWVVVGIVGSAVIKKIGSILG